jgi:drug/metabolite transporter (DMT)-like permease
MRFSFSRLDAWLLLMAFFWGSNFSVVKTALNEMSGPAFNGVRMLIASALFLAVIAWREGLRASVASIERRDWPALIVTALIGHALYQVFFVGGVARTAVANSSLIFGCTPITVSLLSAALGHERVGWNRWLGTALSLAGVYLVVAHGATQDRDSWIGNAMIGVAMLSWAAYTVGSRPLLDRYSPLLVTGLTMALGSAVYAPCALWSVGGVDVTTISLGAWFAIGYSAVFSLVVAYVIWYTGVKVLGSGHTAIYSNLVPLSAMLVASVTLHEPLTLIKIAGAVAVLAGLAITRVRTATAAEN